MSRSVGSLQFAQLKNCGRVPLIGAVIGVLLDQTCVCPAKLGLQACDLPRVCKLASLDLTQHLLAQLLDLTPMRLREIIHSIAFARMLLAPLVKIALQLRQLFIDAIGEVADGARALLNEADELLALLSQRSLNAPINFVPKNRGCIGLGPQLFPLATLALRLPLNVARIVPISPFCEVVDGRGLELGLAHGLGWR